MKNFNIILKFLFLYDKFLKIKLITTEISFESNFEVRTKLSFDKC